MTSISSTSGSPRPQGEALKSSTLHGEHQVRYVLEQYVHASTRADMPHTAAVTLALAGLQGRKGEPLPPAARRLGQFLLERSGRS